MIAPEEVEETLQKMALILETVVQKIDELEQKILRIEDDIKLENNKHLSEQMNKEKAKSIYGEIKNETKTLSQTFKGIAVYDMILNNNVKAQDIANKVGLDNVTLNNLSEKIEKLSKKVESKSWLNKFENTMYNK